MEPFASSDQYKSAWRKRSEEDAGEEQEQVEAAGSAHGGSSSSGGVGCDAGVVPERASGAAKELGEAQPGPDADAAKKDVKRPAETQLSVSGNGKSVKVMKVEKAENVKKVHEFGAYEPEKYKQARLDFIDAKRKSGACWSMASAAWDLSDAKRELLKDLSIPELKRRRFLPKGAMKNPWA